MNQPNTPHAHESRNVVPIRPDTHSASESVIEGEIVDERPRATFNTRRLPSISEEARQRLAAGAVQLHHRATPQAKRGGKALYREAHYLGKGTVVAVTRVWQAKTNAGYQRDMREARKAGNSELYLEIEARGERAQESRHRRRMELVTTAPLALIKAAGLGTVGITGMLLALGVVLAIAQKDAGLILAPIGGVISAVTWTYWFAVTWGFLVLSVVTGIALVAGVAALRHLGRDHAEVPRWAAPAGKPGEMVNLTPSIVIAALRDLGIKPLRDAIKDDPDAGARMLGMIERYGPGSQVRVTLPPQVTGNHIIKARETLAGNLDRKMHEVHIERSEDSEREFTLWVANSGALDQALPPSPLLEEDFGPVDLYRDTMPWGLDIKGDPVGLNLLQQHFLLSGLSKQGKTAAARALVLWLSLDPSARFRIADLKGFGDWSMFDGLAETLIEGAGAENFIATCDMLEEAVREMGLRYERWRAMGRKGDIGRADAKPGSGFEPLFIVVDEVQKLYGCTTEHPDGGEIGGNGKKSRAARAAQALHDQARAVNIHLLQFSQNPTNANLPAIVREGAMIRGSLFVGTESIARMALGEAAVDTGAAPHALRSGLDRGTVVLAPGESMDLPNGATHTTVRTHFISTEQGYDIAARAKQLRAGIQHRALAPTERDLLDDLVAAFEADEDRVKDTDLVARLRRLAGADYSPYSKLTGTKLRRLVTDLGLGIEPKQRDGYWHIWSHQVIVAHATRDEVSG